MQDVILHVEDSEEDFESTHYAVKKSGYPIDIKHIASGEEAISLLEEKGLSPNTRLIFLDLNLPGVDGFELLQILKKQPSTRRIPVIILTTSRDPLDIDRAYDLGANCYIQKPLDLKRYVEMVKLIYEFWIQTNILPST